jgi:hypothetical protein
VASFTLPHPPADTASANDSSNTTKEYSIRLLRIIG